MAGEANSTSKSTGYPSTEINALDFVLVVYATMRNVSRGGPLVEAAGRTLGRTLEIKQLDVCDENSIKACVDSLPERRVDILSKSETFSLMGKKNVKQGFLEFHHNFTFFQSVMLGWV